MSVRQGTAWITHLRWLLCGLKVICQSASVHWNIRQNWFLRSAATSLSEEASRGHTSEIFAQCTNRISENKGVFQTQRHQSVTRRTSTGHFKTKTNQSLAKRRKKFGQKKENYRKWREVTNLSGGQDRSVPRAPGSVGRFELELKQPHLQQWRLHHVSRCFPH